MRTRFVSWTFALGLLVGLTACPVADAGAGSGGGGAGDSAGQTASAAQGGAGAGAAGKNASTGAAGKTSGGGQAGVVAAGSGGPVDEDAGVKDPGGPAGGSGAAGNGGTARCDLVCLQGERCVLKQVQCIRAPCPPIPECVVATASGAGCGSRGLPPCAADQFCDFPAGSDCGATDRGGVCKARPDLCTADVDPVCGCDGISYSNACAAASTGISVDRKGSCQGDVPQGSIDCDPRRVTCERGTPKCPGGQVPSVKNGCYGDCVSSEACACEGPEQCPQPDSYTCLLSAKHCTPYL